MWFHIASHAIYDKGLGQLSAEYAAHYRSKTARIPLLPTRRVGECVVKNKRQNRMVERTGRTQVAIWGGLFIKAHTYGAFTNICRYYARALLSVRRATSDESVALI